MAFVNDLTRDSLEASVLRSMFEERKRVFVDLLGWEVPVMAGRYEIDQFDGPEATYLVLPDENGEHRASVRLLPTATPHLMTTIFPDLCDKPPPQGPGVAEISRLCVSRSMRALARKSARDQLASALVDYALDRNIHTYTAVADVSWYQQVSKFGWACSPLGFSISCGTPGIIAFRIDVDDRTPSLLLENGIYTHARIQTVISPTAAFDYSGGMQ